MQVRTIASLGYGERCSRCFRRGHLAIEGRAPDGLRFTCGRRGASVVPSPGRTVDASTSGLAALRSQARDALVGLGWKRAIASAAVDEACELAGSEPTIDALIREALRRCPVPTG